MNWKSVLSVVFAVCALGLRLPVFGMSDWNAARAAEEQRTHDEQDHQRHAGTHSDDGHQDRENTVSLAASWELLQEDRADIKAAVKAGDSSAIHDLGLRLESTVLGMAGHRAEVDESRHERFDAYLNQMKTLSHDLRHSAARADTGESRRVATKVEGMMLLLASVVLPAGSADY